MLVLNGTGPAAVGAVRFPARPNAARARLRGAVSVRTGFAVAVLTTARRPRQRDAPGQRTRHQQECDETDEHLAHPLPPSPFPPAGRPARRDSLCPRPATPDGMWGAAF